MIHLPVRTGEVVSVMMPVTSVNAVKLSPQVKTAKNVSALSFFALSDGLSVQVTNF